MNIGNTPIFCALIAVSIINVVLPESDLPLAIVKCPIGIPGRDNASLTGSENGIHCCSLNVTLPDYPLFSLNLSKLKSALICFPAASVNDFLSFAITYLVIKMVNHHQLPHH